MTLTTTVAILDPISPEAVWCQAERILGAERATFAINTDVVAGWSFTMNTPDQGYDALLAMRARTCTDAEPYDETSPDADILVSFDTPYSGTSRFGEDSDTLHRRLCAELGAWLDIMGLRWSAQDEYSGIWHDRTPCPIETVGAGQ